MSEDDPRVLRFPSLVTRLPATTSKLDPVDSTRPKFGLYPLGSSDVIMSNDLLQAICALLEVGNADDRKLMAENLRESHRATFGAAPDPPPPTGT